MSGTPRFGANELGPTSGSELDDAMHAVDALEDAAGDLPVGTRALFSDRVMAAIADEPSPAPGGFLMPLRRNGAVGGFVDSLRQAWASIGAGRPAFARAAALAYVLLVATVGVSLAGAASFGAAGAFGFLTPQTTTSPSTDPIEQPEATLTPAVESNEPSSEPSEAPEASPDESEGPDDHGSGSAPAASDDHGDNSGPGGGDDDDRSGPGQTDEPGPSDDHSGSGGDSGPSSTDDPSGSDDGIGSGGGAGLDD